MRKIVLALCALSLPLLAGCITAYKGSKMQIADCKAYDDRYYEEFIAEELNGKHLPDLIRPTAQRYRQVVSETNRKTMIRPVIIRYSEAGNLSSQCDVELALEAIRSVRQDKIVLVFVHGWLNDSGQQSNALYNFDEAEFPSNVMGDDLRTFATLAASVSSKSERPVIPIYVSWKGGPGLGFLNPLSFWDRRDAADRIARTGELNMLFGAIERITRSDEAPCLERPRAPGCIDDHVIYMAHSFGSRILFSSVVADLISRTQLAAPETPEGVTGKYKTIGSPADLILLFNPALEASSYRALDQFRYTRATYDENKLPLMMVMQSESDKAVGMYFPIGQFFGAFLNATRITGLGFKPEFRTHIMCPRENDAGCQGLPRDQTFPCPSLEEKAVGVTQIRSDPQCPYVFVSAPGKELKSLFELDDSNVNKLAPKDSPFDVIHIKEEILDGHTWFSGKPGIDNMFSNDKQDNGKFNRWLAALLADVVEENAGAPVTIAVAQ